MTTRTIEDVINYAEDKGLLLDTNGPKADTLRAIIKYERLQAQRDLAKQLRNLMKDGVLDTKNSLRSNIDWLLKQVEQSPLR